MRRISRWVTSLRDPETLMSALALVLIVGVSFACVSAGDKATTSSSSSAANSNQPALGEAGNEFFASPDATITVTVAAGAGVTSVANLKVFTDRGNYGAVTDANGNATLSVKGGATYNVFAIYNGHKTQVTEGVFVGSGKTVAAPTLTFSSSTLLAAGEQTYVGSGRCIQCHYGMTKGDAQIKAWLNAAHRGAMMAPADTPGMLDKVRTAFANSTDLRSAPKWVGYTDSAPRLSMSGDTYYVTIGNVAYAVKYVMGFRDKQRYVTQIGKSHYVLPIQYNVASETWVTYNPTDWAYTGTVARLTSSTTLETDVYKLRSWERACIGCHGVTGILSLAYSASTTTGIEQHQASYVEKGIGCEACHGPGSDHVAAPTTTNIVNPKNRSMGQQLDICGQCHSRGQSVGYLAGLSTDTYRLDFWYNGTRTFRPGDTVVRGFTDGTGLWDTRVAENQAASSHRQQWNDLYHSGHSAPGAAIEVTCGSCHNTHGPTSGLPNQILRTDTDNALCLTCHGATGNANQRFATDSSVMDHLGLSHRTYTPGTDGKGRCVTCHMPYSAKTGSIRDVHSHTFRVMRPHATYRWFLLGKSATDPLPNSCLQSCHNGTGSETTFTVAAPAATTIDGLSVVLPDSAQALGAAKAWDSYVQLAVNTSRLPSTPQARLFGRVVINGATNVEDTFGAWVTIDGKDRAWTTNREGYFTIIVDSPGVYKVTAWKQNYDSVSRVCTGVTALSPIDSDVGDFVLTASVASTRVTKPIRCEACHGGTIGAEWQGSGLDGRLNSLTYLADTALAGGKYGHGGAQYSGSTFYCARCHDPGADSGSIRHLITLDTHMGHVPGRPTLYVSRPNASKEGVVCLVCHAPHGQNTNAYNLRQIRTTPFERNFFHDANGDTRGSMGYPPAYNSTACFMCHSARQLTDLDRPGGPTQNANGHYSCIIEAYFGIETSAIGSANDSSPYIIRFDSGTTNFADTARISLSAHRNMWGSEFTQKAVAYTTNGAKLLTPYKSADPSTWTERMTCQTCHMFKRPAGYTSDGVAFKAEYGHTFEPDIRVCGKCHDPAIVGAGGLNTANALAGSTTGWGTTWGINSAGKSLGFYRMATKDYDGDGTVSSLEIELLGLVARVDAALCSGTATFGTETRNSGITVLAYPGVDTGMGHAVPSSTVSFYSTPRGIASDTDARRIVWNRNFYYYNKKSIAVHNPRWAVTILRECWAVAGRHLKDDPTWRPPGDDY